MSLGTRIVAALILAAIVPMVVVLAVPLVQAEKRATEETARRLELARNQAMILVDEQRADLSQSADRAAEDLGSHREALAAVVRGPESLARPVAQALAERFVLAKVAILSETGTTLAAYGIDEVDPETAVLVERRRLQAGPETLTLVATRWLAAEPAKSE